MHSGTPILNQDEWTALQQSAGQTREKIMGIKSHDKQSVTPFNNTPGFNSVRRYYN